MIVCSEIKANPRRYRIALIGPKVAISEELSAVTKGGRSSGELALRHPREESMKLSATLSALSGGKYHLRIFAKNFCEETILRFDSDGEPHYNEERGQGLPRRRILTPHFHFYNQEGREMVFWSCQLEDENFRKLVRNNSAIGVKHFCQEGKITTEDGGEPVVQFDVLPMGLSSTDPLAHFPNEP